MNSYLSSVNAGYFYGIVAVVLTFIMAMCLVFCVKSYRAGVAIGMEEKALKKVITSSMTFTLLPSISILLGVIALSGTLGVPLSWLRLSVIGALQYELNVADIAAQGVGLSGLNLAELNIGAFVTIALVMTIGILGGVVCCIFFLKKYMNKLQGKGKKEKQVEEAKQAEQDDFIEDFVDDISDDFSADEKDRSFGTYATTAMFVGLCAAYIGSYVGKAMPSGGADLMPLFVAGVAALCMAVFEFLIQKKNYLVLENFSLAASMLVAMTAAVLVNMVM
jgi:hypothetical protein